MFRKKRVAISQTAAIIGGIVLLVALIAGGYLATYKANPNAQEVDITIVEDNPVLQLDHFYPDKVIVPLGKSITIAVFNDDDETRLFTLSQFNVNMTMSPGTAQRVTFVASSLGNFSYISPKTPPSPVSQGRPGPCLEGFFDVTNSTALLSTTSTSSTSVNGTIITACLTSP